MNECIYLFIHSTNRNIRQQTQGNAPQQVIPAPAKQPVDWIELDWIGFNSPCFLFLVTLDHNYNFTTHARTEYSLTNLVTTTTTLCCNTALHRIRPFVQQDRDSIVVYALASRRFVMAWRIPITMLAKVVKKEPKGVGASSSAMQCNRDCRWKERKKLRTDAVY